MNAKRLHLVNKLQEAAIEAAMRKIWQRERANGETDLGFSEWLLTGKNEEFVKDCEVIGNIHENPELYETLQANISKIL
jgi:hypothetical protein